MLVGIDLFARRCIEGVPLTKTAAPVTYPPQLARRQPPKRPGVGACTAVSGAPVQKGFSAMNFRILAASVWPRGRVFVLLAAAALTPVLLAPNAQAQAPAPAPGAPAAAPKAKAAPKAAPKAPPAAPAPSAQQAPPPAAGGPAAGAPAASGQPQDQQVQLIYAPWTKFCLKGQDANAKQVCFTGKDGRIESG